MKNVQAISKKEKSLFLLQLLRNVADENLHQVYAV